MDAGGRAAQGAGIGGVMSFPLEATVLEEIEDVFLPKLAEAKKWFKSEVARMAQANGMTYEEMEIHVQSVISNTYVE